MAEIDREIQYLKINAIEPPQTIYLPASPHSRETKSGNNGRPASIHLQRKTYGVAVRGKSRLTYHGNRPMEIIPAAACTSEPGKRLADFLARGASIGRIATGHYFRGAGEWLHSKRREDAGLVGVFQQGLEWWAGQDSNL